MVTNARRNLYIDFMKSSSDNNNICVGMSPCISYHRYYPCFGAFYYYNPYFVIQISFYWIVSFYVNLLTFTEV